MISQDKIFLLFIKFHSKRPKFLFYFSKSYCVGYRLISVADFGWRVNRVKCRCHCVYKMRVIFNISLGGRAATQKPPWVISGPLYFMKCLISVIRKVWNGIEHRTECLSLEISPTNERSFSQNILHMAGCYILANPSFKVPYFTLLRLHKSYIKTQKFRLSTTTQATKILQKEICGVTL